MLAAQAKNKAVLGDQLMPIYGCYIFGRSWFFIVLEGTQYAISDVYTATKKDIFDIVKILKGLKLLLLKQVEHMAL